MLIIFTEIRPEIINLLNCSARSCVSIRESIWDDDCFDSKSIDFSDGEICLTFRSEFPLLKKILFDFSLVRVSRKITFNNCFCNWHMFN